MGRHKITVVGAGNVGAAAAQYSAESELGDVVLLDVVEGVGRGKALDLTEAAPIRGHDSRFTGARAYDATAASDIVVITAGMPRKPGMSRDDLLRTNHGIVRSVTGQVARHSPDSILIVVSNPLDAMVQTAFRASGFPKTRVIGMAGVLDSARFRAFIAMELGVSVENVHAFVMGGHGDTMVPVPRYSTVAGVPITELMTADTIERLVERTRAGGAEIVDLLGTSAWYAPGAAIAEMVRAILLDTHRILPCAAYLEGEYGISGLYVGVPAKLGRAGVEEIIQVALTLEERAALHRSAAAVRRLVDIIGV